MLKDTSLGVPVRALPDGTPIIWYHTYPAHLALCITGKPVYTAEQKQQQQQQSSSGGGDPSGRDRCTLKE